MRLRTKNNKFVKQPHIDTPVDMDELLSTSMKYFDKDGYELNKVEQLFHRAHGVDIDQHFLYHTANHIPWYIDIEESEYGPVLDHSMMMQRWAYTGDALAQIKEAAKRKPELNKLLSIKPKWGFDLSIDFVYEGGAFELFHIEFDYHSYADAVYDMNYYEQVIDDIVWEDSVNEILRRKDEWEFLCSDDQADWKAKFFGFHRAFDNRKVFK